MAYTPTTWATGNTVTPALLNNIESGVTAAVGVKVRASDYGINSNGVADNSNAFDAIATALGGLPAIVDLTPEPGGKGRYAISRPIKMAHGQHWVGPGITDSGANPLGYSVSFEALSGFTGDAVFQSTSWTNGIGPGDSWHWASLERVRIECLGRCAYGIAIYETGEASVIREVRVTGATNSNIILAGTQASASLHDVSSFTAGQYLLKLTSHPSGGVYTGNSGVVRLDGFSGDDAGAAQIYLDGSHALTAIGWKSELKLGATALPGILIAGSGTPDLFVTGYHNTVTGSTGDLIKITGTAAPKIAAHVRTSFITNYINDTVNSVTIPGTTVTNPSLVTYGGKTVLGGPTVRYRITQTRTGNGSVTVDAGRGDFHEVTLAGNATSTSISNPTPGQELSLAFVQDGTGGRTYVWPTATYANGKAPANILQASARDTIRLIYDGSNWVELSRSRQAGGITTPARTGRYISAPTVINQTITSTLTQNSLKYMPIYFDRACTITAIGLYIPTGTASATVRLGIYADSDGQPTGSPLVDAGTVPATATGGQELTGLTLAVSSGLYWVCGVAQGASAQVVGIPGVSPGIAALAAYVGTADQTCWTDSGTVSGALPTAAPNSHGRGFLISVKVS